MHLLIPLSIKHYLTTQIFTLKHLKMIWAADLTLWSCVSCCCCRYRCVLHFHGDLHAAMQLWGRHCSHHPLVPAISRKPFCSFILWRQRPAWTAEPALQRQDVTVQRPDLLRKRLTPADKGGGSGWREIQLLHQHWKWNQRIIYQFKNGWYVTHNAFILKKCMFLIFIIFSKCMYKCFYLYSDIFCRNSSS